MVEEAEVEEARPRVLVQAPVAVVDELSLGAEGEQEGQAMKQNVIIYKRKTLNNRTASQPVSSAGSSSPFDTRVAIPTVVATPAPTAVDGFHFGVDAEAGVGLKLEAWLRASSSSACFFASVCLSLHVIPALLTGGLGCCSCSASCARFSNGLTSFLGLGS